MPRGAPKVVDPKNASHAALLRADAKERLELAARAAGLSLEQLVDLVVDSGAAAIPPSALAAPRVTMRELGNGLRLQMQQVDRSDRARWFESLLEVQKGAFIVAMREHGFRSEVIASDLGISSAAVARLFNEHVDNFGAQVVQVRLNTIVGSMQLAAERAQQGLMEEGDWKGFWSVAKDLVKLLQSLGIVDQAARRVEVTHKFDEQKQAELDALLELERKKQARRVEIGEVADAQFQVVPQLEFERENVK